MLSSQRAMKACLRNQTARNPPLGQIGGKLPEASPRLPEASARLPEASGRLPEASGSLAEDLRNCEASGERTGRAGGRGRKGCEGDEHERSGGYHFPALVAPPVLQHSNGSAIACLKGGGYAFLNLKRYVALSRNSPGAPAMGAKKRWAFQLASTQRDHM